MRIDRPDSADEPDGARMDRRAEPAPDNPDSTDKGRGEAAGSDSPRDSSLGPPDSALRAERATAYRAAVDAAYRQHAIDHGDAKMEKPESETVTLATRRIETADPERYPAGPESHLKDRDQQAEATELGNPQVPDRTSAAHWAGPAPDEHDARVHDRTSDFSMDARLASGGASHDADTTLIPSRNDNGPGYPATGTAPDHVQTGARGPASRREFDPETAGGPIQQLDAAEARITSKGVQEVAAHLQRFTGGGSLDAPEQRMLDRLTTIAAGDMEPTFYDLNFFTHELDEASRYAKLGFGPESDQTLISASLTCTKCGTTSTPPHSRTTESPTRISSIRSRHHE